MLFIAQGKTNWKFLLIIFVLAVIVGGGIIAYQYWWLPKKEIMLPEIKISRPKSQCQITLREGAADKTKSGQTIEGETRILLKFREGSEVRLRNGEFLSLCGENLSQINNLINGYPNISIQRLFSLSEEELAGKYNELKQKNSNIADLNLWYRINLPENTNIETVDSLINKLNEFYVIEIAYPEPLPAPLPSGEPFLRIISPNGGEKWKVGDVYEIIWESFGVEKVALGFWVPGDNPNEAKGVYSTELSYQIDSVDSLEIKAYSWKVDTSVLSSYIDYGGTEEWRVSLTGQGWPIVSDQSDEPITIYRETLEEYQEALAKKEEEERQARNQELAQICLQSNGQIVTTKSCLPDFLINSCGMPFENDSCLYREIKEIQTCNCGLDRCFSFASGCIDLKDKERVLINQEVADLKGEGVLQLTGFYELAGGVDGSRMGVVRVFEDETENTMIWESFPFSLEFGGYLSVKNNPAIGKKVIRIDWGAGAHGMVAKFFYWDGESFKEMGEFFSDGGGIWLDQETGEILVGTRNYDCPLSETIWSIYEWNGDEYELTKTIESECP